MAAARSVWATKRTRNTLTGNDIGIGGDTAGREWGKDPEAEGDAAADDLAGVSHDLLAFIGRHRVVLASRAARHDTGDSALGHATDDLLPALPVRGASPSRRPWSKTTGR